MSVSRFSLGSERARRGAVRDPFLPRRPLCQTALQSPLAAGGQRQSPAASGRVRENRPSALAHGGPPTPPADACRRHRRRAGIAGPGAVQDRPIRPGPVSAQGGRAAAVASAGDSDSMQLISVWKPCGRPRLRKRSGGRLEGSNKCCGGSGEMLCCGTLQGGEHRYCGSQGL
jgi:hypothetical protein